MNRLTDEEWNQIRHAVDSINENNYQSRVDMVFGNVTVLVYRAGTVIRVDFKET